MEWQKLNATYGLGGSSSISDRLNSFKANASFVWDHTYSAGLGYFNIAGSSDCNMYGVARSPLYAQRLRRLPQQLYSQPERRRSHPRPCLHALQPRRSVPLFDHDVRLGVQFTEYLHLYGGTRNFDGSYLGGTHNAAGNNSVFAYAWVPF